MSQREHTLSDLQNANTDVFVVGGGVNGAVVSLALAARGASVACATREDFGAGTSQQSSNLIWGGFKYLEGYEIPLVAGLCRSRNRLAKAFPNRLVETRFLATLDQNAPYAPWFATLGAAAYWALGRFFTAPPAHRSKRWIRRTEPAVRTDTARGAIEYSDYVIVDNDARFVAQMLFEASSAGATIANYVELVHAERLADRWRLHLVDTATGQELTCTASILVNAGGPFVPNVSDLAETATQKQVVLSKGIHLVVPRITDSGRVLAFYDDSRRLFYVLPMGHRSVVGTTDTRTSDPNEPVTDEDRRQVLEQINKRIAPGHTLTPDDIIAERVGVRPLVVDPDVSVGEADWTSLSRRHAVETDRSRSVISVLGGKLSDCVNVGEEVADEVAKLGVRLQDVGRNSWFGEPSDEERAAFISSAHPIGLAWRPSFEDESTYAQVLWRRYGHGANAIVERVRVDPDSGRSLMSLADYSEAEVRFIGESEWVVTLDDFLRRRTLLGQLNRPTELAADAGVRRAVELLFGHRGLEELDSPSTHTN